MIYHILEKETWLIAQKEGEYNPPSITEEGFIHCSEKKQLVGSANLYFKGKDNLLILCIEEEKVDAKIRYEGVEILFPHIYGTLKFEAVQRVLGLPKNDHGEFELPPELQF